LRQALRHRTEGFALCGVSPDFAMLSFRKFVSDFTNSAHYFTTFTGDKAF
jgi:hypothetical protein